MKLNFIYLFIGFRIFSGYYYPTGKLSKCVNSERMFSCKVKCSVELTNLKVFHNGTSRSVLFKPRQKGIDSDVTSEYDSITRLLPLLPDTVSTYSKTLIHHVDVLASIWSNCI